MKRLVICYDGTWNAVTNPDEVTNVVRVAQAVKSLAEDGTAQVVYYNAGVGSGGPLDQFLGGVFGVGLRNNVKRGLAFLSLNWDPEELPGTPDADEIYIFGFSRGAYSARARRRHWRHRRHSQAVELRPARDDLESLSQDEGRAREG
jgi:uncharacterized protein (DUF2235 family)